MQANTSFAYVHLACSRNYTINYGIAIVPRNAMLVRYMLSSCVRLSIRNMLILYQSG